MAEPRFIADLNVGRLAKWLRVMGYDTLLIPDIEDGELVRVALKEDRIVLTRDRYIMRRRMVVSGELKALLILSDALDSQLRQVVEAYGLNARLGFSRCIECNVLLLEVPREDARERVPPFVFQTQEEFMECPSCQKMYWRGTHWHNMRLELARLRNGS
ncbi:MAG: Mut7-C RNAse domain-containing protein [Chloroflexi bacterium]|nr:Mut7-C RNAse domain-containing protein [Chloroflexota bacterium]